MSSRSLVAALPPSVVRELHDWLWAGITHRDVAARLAERGHIVSKSSVGRYAKGLQQEWREATRLIRIADLARASGREPGEVAADISAMALTRAAQAVLDAVSGEDLEQAERLARLARYNAETLRCLGGATAESASASTSTNAPHIDEAATAPAVQPRRATHHQGSAADS